MTPFAHFHAPGWWPRRMLWCMSVVIRLASHSHSSLKVLKLSLSGQGTFFCDWWNSALLTLASSILWWPLPSRCGGGATGSADGGGNAVLSTISAFSSREIAVLPSRSLSAGVVDDAHGLVYYRAVQQCSLCPRTSSDPCRTAAQHCLLALQMV